MSQDIYFQLIGYGIFIRFKFREVSTQTPNTYESALGILKDAMNDPSFIKESAYFAINKHVRKGMNNQPIRSLSGTGNACYIEKEHLLNSTFDTNCPRKSVPLNGVVSLQQPLITAYMRPQCQYSAYPAIPNLPSALSSLHPQGPHPKAQRTNKKTKDVNRSKNAVASNSNVLYTSLNGTILSKHRTESKTNKNKPRNIKGISKVSSAHC